MRNIGWMVGAVLVVAGVAACADETRRVSASNPTVTYSVPDRDHLEEADEKAAEYCDDFGQSPSLHDLTERDGKIQATYECV